SQRPAGKSRIACPALVLCDNEVPNRGMRRENRIHFEIPPSPQPSTRRNTMSLPSLLVSTKFAPPRLGRKAIKRARLLERLREARHCRLVIVTGSAGFGKTTLLAQWRQELLQTGAEVSWLLLGPAEARMSQFWSYLAGALARLGIAGEDDSLLLGDAQDQR